MWTQSELSEIGDMNLKDSIRYWLTFVNKKRSVLRITLPPLLPRAELYNVVGG